MALPLVAVVLAIVALVLAVVLVLIGVLRKVKIVPDATIPEAVMAYYEYVGPYVTRERLPHMLVPD